VIVIGLNKFTNSTYVNKNDSPPNVYLFCIKVKNNQSNQIGPKMFSRFSTNFFKVSRAKKLIALSVPLALGATIFKNNIIEKEVETVLCENKSYFVQDKNKMDPEIQKQNEQRQIIYKFVLTGGPCAGKSVWN
jgi:hypothetical protein